MKREDRIFVAGHEAMIGAAIVRALRSSGYENLITKNSAELDLTDQKMVFDFFMREKPHYVFLTSARVGGILANSQYPADFIYANIQSQTNMIHSAWRSGVKKLLFLGSSCVYPKNCPQPMREEYLLTGKLEPTSEPYAIAKIAGIRMCQAYRRQYGADFISAIPADLYGPEDDFDPQTAHVLPALIARMHHASSGNKHEVTVWGTGAPMREWLHVDDLADACVFLMNAYNADEMINIGPGEEVSVKELSFVIKNVVGFAGEVVFDPSKPDGMPRKLLDSTRIGQLGWTPKIGLKAGIRQTYEWFKVNTRKNMKLERLA